jgi:hypothetical protein
MEVEIAMRNIQLSDSTYAALWSKWQDGDQGEEGILRRVLGLKPEQKATEGTQSLSQPQGYTDPRSGVFFPEGFEIFRVFKGKELRARVEGRMWRNLSSDRLAPSLNTLSAQIGAPTENAWMGWRYSDNGKERLISELRDPARIHRR